MHFDGLPTPCQSWNGNGPVEALMLCMLGWESAASISAKTVCLASGEEVTTLSQGTEAVVTSAHAPCVRFQKV